MINADVFYTNGASNVFLLYNSILLISKDLLRLSSCGYDEGTRQHLESQKPGSPMKDQSWRRRVPYQYTGCLAHVEITERNSDGEVSRIMGYFLHNEGCNKAVLTQLPAIPLHEHVYEVALDQLELGARYETYFPFSVHPDSAQHFCSPNLQS
jgi:hypothetical protein